MAKLMGGDAPPAAGDAPMLARMAKIGIVPGKPFEMGKLDPAVQAALKNIPQARSEEDRAPTRTEWARCNGWIRDQRVLVPMALGLPEARHWWRP